MSSALAAYREANRPIPQPRRRPAAKEYIANNLNDVKKMMADGYSDDQLAEAVSGDCRQSISGKTFRRYYEAAATSAHKPRRARGGRKDDCGDKHQAPLSPAIDAGTVIEHDPLEPTHSALADEDED